MTLGRTEGSEGLFCIGAIRQLGEVDDGCLTKASRWAEQSIVRVVFANNGAVTHLRQKGGILLPGWQNVLASLCLLSITVIKFLSETISKLFHWEYYALPNSYQLIKYNLNGILLILSLPNRQFLMLLDKNIAQPWITLIKCKYKHGMGQNVFYSSHAVSVYGRYSEGKDDFMYTKHTIFNTLCQVLYVDWFVTCNCHNQLVRKFLCLLHVGSL